jgi:aspartate/glutamate racemase
MTATSAPPRIALIHAVYVAMAPVEVAFKRRWPEAQRVNLVDDALPADLERDGQLTERMHARIRRLADHALAAGADGVLFTCSAFGDAIAAAAAALPVPVLKPNEAMFEAALRAGTRIGMLATFAPAVASMEEEFHALARAQGISASLETICVPEAIAAARAGDIPRHDRLVAEAAPKLAHCDAVMLAHFSTSTALDAVQAVLRCPVLSAPEAAVDALRRLSEQTR